MRRTDVGRMLFGGVIPIAITWLTAAFIFICLDNAGLIFVPAALVTGGILFSLLAPGPFSRVARVCFRRRWLIALAIFAVLVAFHVSGSSIGIVNKALPTRTNGETTTLFGEPRKVRADEWNVLTPKYLSQAYNDYGRTSTRMSLSETDMVVDYYSPVWDLTAIGKPLMWGFLLFGSETGLSWYWCGLEILLFMTALEMVLILTERKKIALLGAAMVALAPAIQWWVLPHMPIVIMYAMALFDIGYYFFTARRVRTKWFAAALAAVAVIGFGLSLFPSLQVPCVYVVAILLFAVLWRDRKAISFRKWDWLRIGAAVAGAGVVLAWFVWSGRDALTALMNTVYPGDRVYTGGNISLSGLFSDLSSLFLPYRKSVVMNNCEVSDYFHFAPFFILLFPRLLPTLRRERARELPVGIAFLGVLALEVVYMCVGIPEFLAKLTLLNYCNRMHSVYGWTATLFTLWGISVLARHPKLLKKWEWVAYPAAYGVLSLLLTGEGALAYFDITRFGINIGRIALVCCVIGFAGLLFLWIAGKKRLFAWGMAAVMAVGGLTVNPVEIGIGAVEDHPFCECVRSVASEDSDGMWLCVNCTLGISSVVLENGGRCLSATNFYPDAEKWAIIDPEGIYEEYTNRYANQRYFLTEEANRVELLLPDAIDCYITPRTVVELGVRYIVSGEECAPWFADAGIGCELLAEQDGYYIYRLTA